MELRRVTSEEFKKALKANSGVDDLLAVKGFASTVSKEAGDDAERILTFTISTADVDRDGDTISASGWELDNFIKGGSVLWAHDAKTPAVAKPLATWMEDGKLKSRAQFAPKEMNPFAFMVYEMYRDGYMRGASVGFLPKEWKEVADRAGWMPLDFTRQELLEWSCTPVPSNPNALREAKSKGIDVTPVKTWASKLLDSETPAGLQVSREVAEKLYQATKDDAPTIDIGSPVAVEQSPVGGGDEGGEGVPAVDLPPPQGPTGAAATSTTPESTKSVLDSMHKQVEQVCDDIAERSASLAEDLKALLDLVGKSGRVLSSANESKLRDARDLLSAVIAQVESQDDDTDDKSVTDGDGIDLRFDLEDAEWREGLKTADEKREGLDLDADTLRDAVSDLVGATVDLAIRTAQGRVD